MPDIKLIVNGKAYVGWKEVEITQSLDSLCNRFSMSVSDKFPGDSNKWGFVMGDSCEIAIDNNTIMHGYIEELSIDYDKETHTIELSGRDTLCDLVDCSYLFDDKNSIEQAGQTTLSLITFLCDQFNVKVRTDFLTSKPLDDQELNFVANPGDSVFELISKLCKSKAVLPVSYGDKYLTLTRGGSNFRCADSLVLGNNILTGNLQQSDVDRFSYYLALGHGIEAATKEGYTNDYVPMKGDATDPVMEDKRYGDREGKRYRPTVLLSEKPTDSGEREEFAQWECSRRAGESRLYRYKVQGWLQTNKKPWTINSLVNVNDSFFGLKGKEALLISEVVFNYNNNSGSTTDISVIDQKTYELVAEPIIKSESDSIEFVIPAGRG